MNAFVGNGCPPSDAGAIDLVLYRYIGTGLDWYSFHQRGLAQGCRSVSLSCWISFSTMCQILNVKEDLSDGRIVACRVTRQVGLAKQTGRNPEHYSVWLYKWPFFNRRSLFVRASQP
jgi:hypothetical protein